MISPRRIYRLKAERIREIQGPGEARTLLDHSLFFAISSEMLAGVDAEHRLVTVNPTWAKTFGDATTSEGSSLLDLVHPEDRERITAACAAATTEVTHVTGRLQVRDGTYRSARLRLVRSGEPSGLLYVVATEADIASLRRDLAFVQRRLDALFATMQDEVYLTDEHGVIDGMARTPPGVPREAVLGTVMLNWSAPHERAAMEARYQAVRERSELVTYETAAQFPDGSIQYLASRMGPLLDGDRNVGTVLITRNVTKERLSEAARQRAEDQVREYMIQLERSNSELERFASVASHDLQEPLRKIQAFSDRLRERYTDDLPEAARDYLARMQDAAKRMQDLINDLLMFSRLSSKKQNAAPVNLAKIAKSVLSDLEVRLEESHGTVHLDELPSIEADQVHMRQLLQNLIGNALKFSRPDVPPVVYVRSELIKVPGAGETLRLQVQDNGIGIESRFHSRIFGIFERLHGRGKYEGTGIGLAVCRKIVEQHNGTIEVSSVYGEGTTFTIFLPTKQPERSPASEPLVPRGE